MNQDPNMNQNQNMMNGMNQAVQTVPVQIDPAQMNPVVEILFQLEKIN